MGANPSKPFGEYDEYGLPLNDTIIQKDDEETCVIHKNMRRYYHKMIKYKGYCNFDKICTPLDANIRFNYSDGPLNKDKSLCLSNFKIIKSRTYTEPFERNTDTCKLFDIRKNQGDCYCNGEKRDPILADKIQCLCRANTRYFEDVFGPSKNIPYCFRMNCKVVDRVAEDFSTYLNLDCTFIDETFPFEREYFDLNSIVVGKNYKMIKSKQFSEEEEEERDYRHSFSYDSEESKSLPKTSGYLGDDSDYYISEAPKEIPFDDNQIGYLRLSALKSLGNSNYNISSLNPILLLLLLYYIIIYKGLFKKITHKH